MQILFKLVAI